MDSNERTRIIAEEATIQFRQDICRKCERLLKPTWNCLECGCFMKIKTRLEASKCPIHKW